MYIIGHKIIIVLEASIRAVLSHKIEVTGPLLRAGLFLVFYRDFGSVQLAVLYGNAGHGLCAILAALFGL